MRRTRPKRGGFCKGHKPQRGCFSGNATGHPVDAVRSTRIVDCGFPEQQRLWRRTYWPVFVTRVSRRYGKPFARQQPPRWGDSFGRARTGRLGTVNVRMTIGKSIAILGILGACGVLRAQDQIRLDIEGGVAYQTRNTCAIPADSSKFSYRDLLGRGPFNYGRVTAIINDANNSGYRIVIAPLNISGVGKLPNKVQFSGTTFDPGIDTAGRYIFNNYRFTWWHKWKPIDGIDVRAGWTFFIRDANVSLAQSGKSASFYNLGPVPLYYILAEKHLTDRLRAEFEFDGLVAPEGGALDLGLALGYSLNPTTVLKLRARYLDGGTGSGSAYSYATVNYLSLGLEFRW